MGCFWSWGNWTSSEAVFDTLVAIVSSKRCSGAVSGLRGVLRGLFGPILGFGGPLILRLRFRGRSAAPEYTSGLFRGSNTSFGRSAALKNTSGRFHVSDRQFRGLPGSLDPSLEDRTLSRVLSVVFGGIDGRSGAYLGLWWPFSWALIERWWSA